jgi:hypothetical protein
MRDPAQTRFQVPKGAGQYFDPQLQTPTNEQAEETTVYHDISKWPGQDGSLPPNPKISLSPLIFDVEEGGPRSEVVAPSSPSLSVRQRDILDEIVQEAIELQDLVCIASDIAKALI